MVGVEGENRVDRYSSSNFAEEAGTVILREQHVCVVRSVCNTGETAREEREKTGAERQVYR